MKHNTLINSKKEKSTQLQKHNTLINSKKEKSTQLQATVVSL